MPNQTPNTTSPAAAAPQNTNLALLGKDLFAPGVEALDVVVDGVVLRHVVVLEAHKGKEGAADEKHEQAEPHHVLVHRKHDLERHPGPNLDPLLEDFGEEGAPQQPLTLNNVHADPVDDVAALPAQRRRAEQEDLEVAQVVDAHAGNKRVERRPGVGGGCQRAVPGERLWRASKKGMASLCHGQPSNHNPPLYSHKIPVVDPGTVVIKSCHALLAFVAVLGTRRPRLLARLAVCNTTAW